MLQDCCFVPPSQHIDHLLHRVPAFVVVGLVVVDDSIRKDLVPASIICLSIAISSNEHRELSVVSPIFAIVLALREHGHEAVYLREENLGHLPVAQPAPSSATPKLLEVLSKRSSELADGAIIIGEDARYRLCRLPVEPAREK